MVPIRLRNGGPTLGKSDLAEAAAALSIVWPRDYEEFLLGQNGGCPEPESFCTSSDWGGSAMEEFFSLDLVDFADDSRTMVEIGMDQGGNRLLLGVVGSQRGRVYFRSHDELAGQDDTFEIAPSFAAFLDSFSYGRG